MESLRALPATLSTGTRCQYSDESEHVLLTQLWSGILPLWVLHVAVIGGLRFDGNWICH